MSFHFRLQKIVDLKSNEKTQAEWILSQSLGVLNAEEVRLHAMNSEKEELHHRLNETISTTVNISHLRNFQNYMNHLNHKISIKANDVKQAEQVVVEKKVSLSNKMKDEKVWDNVRSKAKLVFEAAERTSEQKVLDEIAISRYKPSV